jgi:hypothetical protein
VSDDPVVVSCYAQVVTDMIGAGDLDGCSTREVDRSRAQRVHGL